MSVPTTIYPTGTLVQLGLRSTDGIHYQSSPDELVQDTLHLKQGVLSDSGALVITTGDFTGRSPKDKFTVKDAITADTVNWNEFNIPIDEAHYGIIHRKMLDYLSTVPDIWIRDAYACADTRYRMNIRITSDKPWISHFAYNMFLRPDEEELDHFKPEWNLLVAPDLKLDPDECGTRQANATVVSFTHKTILIAGSGYTGETKKGIFSVLNFVLPLQKNVLSMHCSANKGKDGDTAIFFGLSGTGKTTLSTDPHRQLIGDDEHGWADDSIFNFEGGCYAKCIHLTPVSEPEIYEAIRAGALVENAGFYPGTCRINFDDATITENTRVSYPLHYISHAASPAVGDIPSHIFFLTCDAYGVLPPISRLTPGQAMYQFISGYTAKIAGTETGITEPKPTFSACFGAPFLPLHPGKYAAMLGEKLKAQPVTVWLVNTGWTGGPYGKGNRIPLAYTRAMITAALDGTLNDIATVTHPTFGLAIPVSCPGVPASLLQPQNTWPDNKAYEEKARFLAQLFITNFEKYTDGVSEEIAAAAPKV